MNKALLDIVFRIVIIMVPVIGYAVASQVNDIIDTIVLFGTGYIDSLLIGLYGRSYDKYIKW